MRWWDCEFCKNGILNTWILRKMRFWICEFCEKWDFEYVNFVKNEILKLWILWKMRFWKCEFCEKWDFQYLIFWMNCGFLPQFGVWLEFLRICVVSNVWVFQYYTLSIGVSKRQIFQCHNKRVHSMPDAKKIGQSSCSSSATLISLGWKTTNVAMNRNALKAAAHLCTAWFLLTLKKTRDFHL